MDNFQDPGVTIKVEVDASDSSPTATSPQHEPTCSTSDPGVTIKEEVDASDSSPAATSPQPHLWLTFKDEPTCSTSDLDPDGEVKMESEDTDEEMTFDNPLVIPFADSEIQADPLSAVDHSGVDHSKDHRPPLVRGNPSSSPGLERLTARHFPKKVPHNPGEKRSTTRRCVVCSKKGLRKETTIQCVKCDVGLCVDPCFELYHTKRHF